MSGRGQGRGFQAGRGRGRGRCSGKFNSASKVPQQCKTLQDYQYYIGSSKQASNDVTITLYLINHVQKTFDYGDNIASALDRKAEVDLSAHMPQLQQSTDSDQDVKDQKNKQFKMLYEAEIAK